MNRMAIIANHKLNVSVFIFKLIGFESKIKWNVHTNHTKFPSTLRRWRMKSSENECLLCAKKLLTLRIEAWIMASSTKSNTAYYILVRISISFAYSYTSTVSVNDVNIWKLSVVILSPGLFRQITKIITQINIFTLLPYIV